MAQAAQRPNIILILTDHFRRDAVGPSTPSLRKLAHRGTLFANAYCASPLCQPSRASIITGLLPSQHGICGNMADPISYELQGDTFMRHLQEAGYFTALIGRHHYFDPYGIEMDVTERDGEIARFGFDYVFQVVNACEHEYSDCRYTHHLRKQGLLEAYRDALRKTSDGFPFPEEDYDDAFIGRQGCKFVREYPGPRPFYLNLAFNGPHPPYWHPGETQSGPSALPPPHGAPDSGAAQRRRADYAVKCTLIDRYVGQLLEALEQRGVLENTVVIFTSDHGDNLGDYGIWDKRFFYEQSVGVPLILCGPGVPRGARQLTGRVSKALLSELDLYPTLLKIAGAASPPRRRPGVDLLTVLREEAPSHGEVFAELATSAMIRTANWKLVFDPEQGGVQYLFNLAVDPQEAQNLAGVPGYGQVTADLIQRLLAHRIRLTQYTHDKEEQRLQRVRIVE